MRQTAERSDGDASRSEEVAGAPADWLALVRDAILELADDLGLAVETVASVLPRIVAAAAEQGRRYSDIREELLDALLDDLDLRGSVPRPVVEQAHRVATRRRRLVDDGGWSVADLAAVRNATRGAVHTWLARQRENDRLFTVSVGRETYVPALLLDEAAEPHEGLERIIGPLRRAGLDPWALWVWLDSPSGWLDGERPADLISAGDVDAVARAATDKASTAAGRLAEPAA